MVIVFQNGIIAASTRRTNSNPPDMQKKLQKLEKQNKNLEKHIQSVEAKAWKLIDENRNFERQIDDLMKSKVHLYADIEDKIASQADKINIIQVSIKKIITESIKSKY